MQALGAYGVLLGESAVMGFVPFRSLVRMYSLFTIMPSCLTEWAAKKFPFLGVLGQSKRRSTQEGPPLQTLKPLASLCPGTAWA